MLKDLKSDLTKLRHGKDQIGGGSSGEPYIVTPLPSNASTNELLKINSTRESFSGAIAIINGINDVKRINRFLTNSPKGRLWIAKQIGLQLSNPKIETGKILGLENTRTYNGGFNTLAQLPVNAVGIHFDRAGLGPEISKFNKYENVVRQKNIDDPKDNRLVTLYNDKILGLGGIDFQKKAVDKIHKLEDKLSNFTSTRVGNFLNNITDGGLSRTIKGVISDVNRTLDPKYFVIDSYSGGPDSVFGLGKTTINRYEFTDQPRTDDSPPPLSIDYTNLIRASRAYQANNSGPLTFDQLGFNELDPTRTPDYLRQTQTTDQVKRDIIDTFSAKSSKFLSNKSSLEVPDISKTPSNIQGSKPKSPLFSPIPIPVPVFPSSKLNSMVFDYDLIKKQEISDSSNTINLTKPDFRRVLDPNSDVLPSTDYNKFNRETWVGTGNPGKLSRDRRLINNADPATEDTLNFVPLFTEDPNEDTGEVFVNGIKHSVKDLIKFRFEAVNNDDPSKTVKIAFRAFINGFKDNISADWDSHQYVGRGEKFYTYKGFNRSVNFGFKIAAQSKTEMKPLYQKLNFLMSNLAPDYQQNGFMRGSFMLLTMGNWFYRQPGILNSLQLSIEDNYPWEIALDSGDVDSDISELPQIINASVQFTPIHNFIPRKGPSIPFISTGNGEDNNWLKAENFNYLL